LVVLIRLAVPVSHLRLVLKFRELYLKLGGILPPEDNFHLEGTLMLGGSLNLELTINHMDKMCLPLSQSFEFLSLLWVTSRKSQHPLHHQVLVHVMFLLLCLSVQGKYLPLESSIPNILSQNPCQSMFI
jgi:hypothetical protein